MNKNKKIFNFCLISLPIAGFFISLYLSYSHYKVFTDISYKSFCAVSKSLNCDTVSQSKYAVFFNIPVAQWGGFGYLFLLVLNIIGAFKKRIFFFLNLSIVSIFCLTSIFLGFITSYLIHAYCIMCVSTYLINFLMLGFILIYSSKNKIKIQDEFKNDFYYFKSELRILILFSMSFLLILSSLSFQNKYWEFNLKNDFQNIKSGLTENGHPWIGAENPELTIVEYSDYMCFQCKKMHFFLRDFVLKNPDKIRLIHRHYPMDSRFNSIVVKDKFHEGSGDLALIGVYAALAKKFWPVNDALFNLDFSSNKLSYKYLAEKTGLKREEIHNAVNNKVVRQFLDYDIYSGMKLKILGTPTYEINGKTYTGNIPGEVLEKYVK